MANQIIDKALAYLGDSLIKTVNYSCEYTLSANGSISLTGTDFNKTTPSGYAPFALRMYQTGNPNVYMRGMSVSATGTGTVMALKNTSSSTQTGTASIGVAYIKSGVID